MSKYYWCIHLLDEECSNGEVNENPLINKLVIDSSKKDLEVIWSFCFKLVLFFLINLFLNGVTFGNFIDIVKKIVLDYKWKEKNIFCKI